MVIGISNDMKPFARQPHPAVSTDILQTIQDLPQSGMSWEAAIQAHKQLFPSWYTPINWRAQTGIKPSIKFLLNFIRSVL